MPAINIVARYQAIQYTGSNSADIDAAISGLDIVSESGGVLVVESPIGSSQYTVNTNDWVQFTQGQVSFVYDPATFVFYFIPNVVTDDLSSLTDRLDDLEASVTSVNAAGVMQAPTLLFGQSTDVDVNIIPAMPSASYDAHAQLFAASTALGSLSITAVSVLDADTVRVTVQNSGLVSLSGVHILVTATT